VKDIERDDKAGKDQVELEIDFKKLSRLGLTVVDVARNVRTTYDGEAITSVRYGDEDVDFRVLFEERARRRTDYIRELPIPNRQDRLIPLGNVAILKTGPGPADYRRYKGERATLVEADVNKEIITPMEVTKSVFAHFNLGRDCEDSRLVLEGEVQETRKSLISLAVTLALALGYGFLFATPLTLVLVPCFYAVRMDLGRVLTGIGGRFQKSERV
jgi:multidrug efflux pump subunit AcrB